MAKYWVEFSTAETRRRLVASEISVEADSSEDAKKEARLALEADAANTHIRIGNAYLSKED